MPTGYTDQLQRRNYDVKSWLKEDMFRGVGICASLRDYGTLSENQIKEHLKKVSKEKTYEERRLLSLLEESEKYKSYSEEDWNKEFTDKYSEELVAYESALLKFEEEKEKHISSLEKIKNLEKIAIKNKENEVILGVLKYSKQQLKEVIEYDYDSEPLKHSILYSNIYKYKEDKLKEIESDLRYYSENRLAKKVEKDNRLDLYNEFVEFINKELK